MSQISSFYESANQYLVASGGYNPQSWWESALDSVGVGFGARLASEIVGDTQVNVQPTNHSTGGGPGVVGEDAHGAPVVAGTGVNAKLGGLPVWAWGVIALVLVVLVLFLASRD